MKALGDGAGIEFEDAGNNSKKQQGQFCRKWKKC